MKFPRQILRHFYIAMLTFSILGLDLQAAEYVDLQISAKLQAETHSVVKFTLPEALWGNQHFSLTSLGEERFIPVQVNRSGTVPQVVWLLDRKITVGESRKFRLTALTEQMDIKAPVVRVDDDGKHLKVKIDSKPVLSYNHALVESPLVDQPYYARSGYIHPLHSPSGQVVTGDFNPDHPHQHGIMFAWRKMTYEGRSFDCWNQKAGLGRVEHVKTNSIESGPVYGSFSVQLQHVDLTAPDGPLPILTETWNVRVYAIEEFFLFDLESIQKCATDRPVTLEKIHYGGMMIRGHADWNGEDGCEFLTSEGKTRVDGNHTRPRWVDIAGSLNSQTQGITIFDHSDNFRFPQPVRLHPKMPYFCFAPAVIDSFTIEPGQSLVSKYRYHVHRGEVMDQLADKIWENFATPFSVQLLESKN